MRRLRKACTTVGCTGLRDDGRAWCDDCQARLPERVQQTLREIGQHVGRGDETARRCERILVRRCKAYLRGEVVRGVNW